MENRIQKMKGLSSQRSRKFISNVHCWQFNKKQSKFFIKVKMLTIVVTYSIKDNGTHTLDTVKIPLEN